MASFQLKALTPLSESSFLETPISDFKSQDFKKVLFSNNYSYSFGEKFSMHKHGQKELSFSMLRNIWEGDSWRVNPFTKTLQIGGQVLLVDKYDNEYLFTIKEIKYAFKEQNIQYDYICQDSFTYQNIRQNNGYTIQNDLTSESFIGAKNIDWWILQKILPECYLNYSYVALSEGLYMDMNNNIHKYDQFSKLSNVKKIIKEPYVEKKYPEYYETIPFSISNSNASAVLIDISEQLGLMVNFCESNKKEGGSRTKIFYKYFWFEPDKNENISNLTYDPFNSIQSFSLTQAGDSLTTILNVETTENDNETISLFPDIPAFFASYFISNDWVSSKFSNGYFTSLCTGVIYKYLNGVTTDPIGVAPFLIGENPSYVVSEEQVNRIFLRITSDSLDVNNNFNWPNLYYNLSFIDDYDTSYIYVNDVKYTPRNSEWKPYIKNKDGVFKDMSILTKEELKSLCGSSINLYVRISVNIVGTVDVGDIYLYTKFYRDTTQDELDFAKAADEVPWLENKLVDFSYFLQQKIITPSEYASLMRLFQDDLRIINGRLMVLSAEYYEAIHKQTSVLSKITETIDSLSASFNADVIEKYAADGVINDISYFDKAYTTCESLYWNTSNQTAIFNYNELLSDKLNKYFNAQQRFLKNIYNFRSFFNDKTVLNNINSIDTKALNINQTLEEGVNYFLSFQKQNFKKIESDFELFNKESLLVYPLIFANDYKTTIQTINKNNVTDYYVPNIMYDKLQRCSFLHGYDVKSSFYRFVYKIAKYKVKDTGDKQSTINQQTYTFVLHSEDKNYLYYAHKTPVSKLTIEDYPDKIYLNNVSDLEAIKEPVIVSFNEIVSEYLWKIYEQNQSNENIKYWYYHNFDYDKPIWSGTDPQNDWKNFSNEVFSDSDEEANLLSLSQKCWLSCYSEEEEDSLVWQLANGLSIDLPTQTLARFYVGHFPVETVTIKNLKNYVNKEADVNVFINPSDSPTKYTIPYQLENKKGHTVSDFIENWINNTGRGVSVEINNPTNDSEKYKDFTVTLVGYKNANAYFRNVVGNIFKKPATTIGGLYRYALRKVFFNYSTDIWETTGILSKTYDGSSTNSVNTYYWGNKYYDSTSILYAPSKTAKDEYNSYSDYLQTNESKLFEKIEEFSEKELKSIISDVGDINKKYSIVGKTTKPNGDVMYLVNNNSFSNPQQEDFINYYSLFNFTYLSLMNSPKRNKCYYKPTWSRPLTNHALSELKLNTKWKYRLLTQKKIGNDQTRYIFSEDLSFKDIYSQNNYDYNCRINNDIYYPVYNASSEINMQDLCTEEQLNRGVVSVQELCENMGLYSLEWNSETGWIHGHTSSGVSGLLENSESTIISILAYEDFERKNAIPTSTSSRFGCYNGEVVYDDYNAIKVDFKKELSLVEGFFYFPIEDGDFHPATLNDFESHQTWLKWNNTEQEEKEPQYVRFYQWTGDKYERVFSIVDILNSNDKFYIMDGFSTTIEVLDLEKEPYVSMYANKITRENGLITEFISTDIGKQKITLSLGDGSVDQKYIDNEGNTYSSRIEYKTISSLGLQNLTNAECWWLFRDKASQPVLQNRAAAIEAQLTEYWLQAYNASFHCEYFIPERWQHTIDGKSNYFSSHLFTVKENTDEQNNTRVVLSLSNTAIPDVEIFSYNGQSSFPKYEFHYNSGVKEGENSTASKNILGISYKSASFLKNQVLFKNIMQLFDDDWSSYTVEEYGKTSYYYSITGGKKWSEVLEWLKPSEKRYSRFSGDHVLSYRILKQSFKSKPISLYEEELKTKEALWSSISRNYSGLLLENSFSTKQATNWKELSLASKNAFKDLSHPESSYNLSVLDFRKLKEYQGQEFFIGQGIKIAAEDFSEPTDWTQKILSQYLFISDISYSLRSDADIQLTVNNIKYQDKLIQRLVKLIK